MRYLILIIGIVGIDQLVKHLIASGMVLHSSIPIWNFIKLTYIHNTGAAFGILSGARWLFMLFAILLVIFVILLWRKPWMKRYHLAVSFIVAGAIGNAIDRLLYGYVIDFIDLTWWPVFNIADISVCCGAILLIILMLTDNRSGGTGKKRKKH